MHRSRRRAEAVPRGTRTCSCSEPGATTRTGPGWAIIESHFLYCTRVGRAALDAGPERLTFQGSISLVSGLTCRRLRGRVLTFRVGITPPTSSLRRLSCFLQFLEQILDAKVRRCEFVDEYILCRCPLCGVV